LVWQNTEKWVHDQLQASLKNALSELEIAAFTAEGATWSEDRASQHSEKAIGRGDFTFERNGRRLT
jgi:hypothetical protein